MKDNGFAQSDLHRQFHALLLFGVVFAVDYAAKKLRVREGKLETDWIPFPAESGRNYRRWRPIKIGQQFTVLCRGGDTAQGRIVSEDWWDDNDSPSTDENIDLIEYTSGAMIRYDASTNVLEYSGFNDVIVNGISVPFHLHDKVKTGTDNTGKPQ